MADNSDRPLWPVHRRRPFPLYWTLGVLGVWGVFLLTWATRDFKIIATQVALGALIIGLLAWFAARGRASKTVRWGAVIVAATLALAVYFSVDVEVDGDGQFVSWRWSWQPQAYEQIQPPEAIEPGETPLLEPDSPRYPAFLGGRPWAEVTDVAINPDWKTYPPEELWRVEVGAGWSAFAVSQGVAVTQEQRDEQEMVVAYRVADGEVLWWHGDPIRFDPFGPMPAMGGAGPRATPAVHHGLVVTQGATGLVNCLDLATGSLKWARNLNEEFEVPNLMWGKSSSPLMLDDTRQVVIAVGDTEASEDPTAGRSLVALDLDTGEVCWSGGGRVTSYATPTVATLAGRRQVVQVNQHFVTGHDAEDGRVLWEFPWPGSSSSNASCSQAVPLVGDRVFLSKGYGGGAALLDIRCDKVGAFTAEPVWRKGVLRTKFGNVVFRDGYAYGIDGITLQCVEVATGKRVWKKRRRPAFGHGQLMLVGPHLLVLTELGEIVLAEATPDAYRELASLQALDSADVTWNNPALAGPHLLVRNAREAVCYRLTLGDADQAVD